MNVKVLVKHIPLVAALRKSFLSLVLGLSPYVLFCLFCPWNVLVLPLLCPDLALESAQNPFDVLTMAFFSQKAFGRALAGAETCYL